MGLNDLSPTNNERQAILTRLLDAVKQCQVRFGGKTELATESDSRISCLCATWESALQHGMKHTNRALSTLKQVSDITGITKVTSSIGLIKDISSVETEPVFWHYVKLHLSRHDLQRYYVLKNINTESGRGKAWLRAAFNEHSLERYLHMLLENDSMLSQYYEEWAFLRDQEKSSMMPNMAAGLGSILFAISIDNIELNTIKPASGIDALLQSPNQTASINNNAPRSDVEPRPVIAGEGEKKRLKKKKKKAPTKLVSFDEDDSSSIYSASPASSVTSPLMPSSSYDFSTGSLPTYSKHIRATMKKQNSEEFYKTQHKPPVAKQSSEDVPNSKLSQFSAPEEIHCASSIQDHSSTFHSVSKISCSSSHSYPELKSLDANFAPLKTFESDPKFHESTKETEFLPPDKISNSESLGYVYLNQQSLHSELSTTLDFGIQSNAQSDEVNKTELEKTFPAAVSEGDGISSLDKCEGSNSVLKSNSKNVSTYPCEDHSLVHKRDSTADGYKDLFNIDNQNKAGTMNNENEMVENASLFSHENNGLKNDEVKVGTKVIRPKDLIQRNDISSLKSLNSTSSSETIDDSVFNIASGLMPVMNQDGLDEEVPSSPTSIVDSISYCSNEVPYLEDTVNAAIALSAVQKGLENSIIGPANLVSSPINALPLVSDSLSPTEMKHALISIMQIKEEVEKENSSLRKLIESEREEKHTRNLQIDKERIATDDKLQKQEDKHQALLKENELLKHQLRKYVTAVQMLRNKTSAESEELGIHLEDPQPEMPPAKPMIDYSFEASEYEKKLIQVAEMHGELMEFNELLHRQLSMREAQVKQMRQELIDLRGPLPEELSGVDDTSSIYSDVESLVGSNRPLINVWIPSAFLRGSSSDAFHVYQIYIRIRDEEWNVYRRYTEFHDFHQALKRKIPAAEYFDFPKKKTIGSKNPKFVEDRRRKLQTYVRRVINLVMKVQQNKTDQMNRKKLGELLPFFIEQPPKVKDIKNKKRSRGNVNQPGPSNNPSNFYEGL